MKYFTYQLYPIGPGAAITPSGRLPVDAIIGIPSDTPYFFYGCAEIANFDNMMEFNPVEVTQEEFEAHLPVVPDSGSL